MTIFLKISFCSNDTSFTGILSKKILLNSLVPPCNSGKESRKQYLNREDFSKPKIVFQEIVQESQFFYDMDGRFICNDTCRIIVGKELSFLLGVLNSKLFFYAIKHFYGGGVLGEHGIRMKHTFFQNFPCIQYNSTIDKLVKELTEKKNAKVENQIGNKIYNLYGLTPQEIQMVEE